MRKVNIHEAKTHLSRLADDVEAGETITLAKSGRPVALIVPLGGVQLPEKPRRKVGFLDGRYKVPENFDTMFEDEIVEMFEGRE